MTHVKGIGTHIKLRVLKETPVNVDKYQNINILKWDKHII